MKAMELRDLSLQELKKRLADEQENLAHLRFQLSTSQVESPIKIRTVRRDIARIKTVLRLKEHVQQQQQANSVSGSVGPQTTREAKTP